MRAPAALDRRALPYTSLHCLHAAGYIDVHHNHTEARIHWGGETRLTTLELDLTEYGGHILRAGLVTSAAIAGVSERIIMQ